MSNTIRCIIIEFGTLYIRIGLSGESLPRYVFKHNISNIHQNHLNLNIKLHELFHKIFVNLLQIKSKLCSVLIIEKFLGTKYFRDNVITILLKDFQIQSVSMQPDLYLGLLGVGLENGLVLNIGEYECQCMCFAYGKPLIQTLKVANVGMFHAKLEFHSRIEKLLCNSVEISSSNTLFDKVVCCNVKNFIKDENFQHSNIIDINDITIQPFQGLCNQSFLLQASDRQDCLASIISGDNYDENDGVSGIVISSLKACNMDLRVMIASNIIAIGGGSMIPGLVHTICAYITYQITPDIHQTASPLVHHHSSNISSILSKLNNSKLVVYPTIFNRSLLSWIGGSLFSSTPSNKDSFVTLEQLKYIEDSKDNKPVKDIKSFDNILLNAPDWQSLNTQDWIFYKAAVCVNDIDKINTTSIKRTSYSNSNLSSKNITTR